MCTPHFKMEGIHTLKTLLQPGDWLAKVDLKNAYFSILIHPDHRKYLSFQLGQNKAYQFTCLPFGLDISTLGLYQDPQACCSPRTRAGDASNISHRRHSPDGGVQGETMSSSSGPCVPTGNAWGSL